MKFVGGARYVAFATKRQLSSTGGFLAVLTSFYDYEEKLNEKVFVLFCTVQYICSPILYISA